MSLNRKAKSKGAKGESFRLLKRILGVARLDLALDHKETRDRLRASSAVEIYERTIEQRRSRRKFLRAAAMSGAALPFALPLLNFPLGNTPQLLAQERKGGILPRIAIVGAGLAGLNAARTLKKAGYDAAIFDASRRSGGRVLSLKDVLAKGITTEFGGEFIDSGHADIFELIKELKLEVIDLVKNEKSLSDGFYFEGKLYKNSDLAKHAKPFVQRVASDAEKLPDSIEAGSEGFARELDRLSISEYLDRVGLTGWFRSLIEVAYLTEYGLECGEQSALNLVTLLAGWEDFSEPQFFGESDERYKVRGGNSLISQGLEQRYAKDIQYGHALEAISAAGSGYKLSFKSAGSGATEYMADFVILAIPFTLLREVRMSFDLPQRKKRAISELGYGMNSKVMLGLSARPWRSKGLTGTFMSDGAMQLAWDNSRMQGGSNGAITFFYGGDAALRSGEGSAEDQAAKVMPEFERLVPGATKLKNGNIHRFHWPTYTFSRCSYSCYRVGQWTSLGGTEITPVGRIFFAGEHCSSDYQGFMNGAAETGRLAAEAVLAALK